MDYLDLDNYSIEYSHILINSIKENNPKLNNISELNPNLTFVIELGNNLNKPLSERFILYDYTTKEVLDRKKNYTIINRRVSDFYIGVNYSCSNEPNCSRKEEDISEDGYFLVISIILPDIDLQNKPSPFKEGSITLSYIIPFYYNSVYNEVLFWEVIKYIEHSTLLDRFYNKKKEYISGHISERYSYYSEPIENHSFKNLVNARLANNHFSYIEYKRKANTFFDLIVKITAIFQSFRFGFLFAFKYYSKNFNNYKIIEKVLDLNNKNFREVELNNVLYKSNSNNNISTNNKNNALSDPLINGPNIKNNLMINDADANNNEIEDLLKTKILPKLSFMHFFCNNLYCNKCSKFKSQETLHICNQILLKYMSIESILYNQIKLENLFKDYNWNNPILNNIEKNNLIDKLKTLI